MARPKKVQETQKVSPNLAADYLNSKKEEPTQTQPKQEEQQAIVDVQELPQPAQVEEKKKKPVPDALYSKYTNLKFLQLSGAKLTDQASEEMEDYLKEIKKCDGRKAKITRRAAINNDICLLVAGVQIPKSIENIIVNNGSESFYLQ
jgi:hypothetical protein